MTDELKRKFEQLVADAPPPSGVPSEGVLDRVRTVKRRRTATAGILATAAVVAGVVAAGNLTKLDSAPPPLTTTPRPTTVVTAPPATTPTPAAPKPTIGGSAQTLPPASNTDAPTNSGGPSSSNTPGVQAPPGPYRLSIKFGSVHDPADPLKLTPVITPSGDVLRPVTEEDGAVITSPQFTDNLLRTEYWFGDGTHVQDDGFGGIFCPQPDQPKTMKKVSGSGDESMALQAHKYAKAGTYKFSFKVTYCTPSGPVEIVRSTNFTVKASQP
jgi:hypothetical protein